MAIDVLSIPVMSDEPERVFSRSPEDDFMGAYAARDV